MQSANEFTITREKFLGEALTLHMLNMTICIFYIDQLINTYSIFTEIKALN